MHLTDIERTMLTVELGVVMGRKARDVSASEAMKYVAGYTLAIDM